MPSESLLERYFAPRRPLIKWAGRHWRAWAMRAAAKLPPLAVLFPEPVPDCGPSPGSEVLRILNQESIVFDTPTFGELVVAAGEPNWTDATYERLGHSSAAGITFNMAILARGLAVVTALPSRAVAFDIVAGPPAVMRVHTSKWVVLLAATTYARAPEIVFSEARRVA